MNNSVDYFYTFYRDIDEFEDLLREFGLTRNKLDEAIILSMLHTNDIILEHDLGPYIGVEPPDNVWIKFHKSGTGEYVRNNFSAAVADSITSQDLDKQLDILIKIDRLLKLYEQYLTI